MLDLLIRFVGLMAVVAILVGSIERQNLTARAKSLVSGVAFGLAACLLILSPVTLSDGTTLNGRSVFLGFSAAFGGPLSFVVASLTTSVWLFQMTEPNIVVTCLTTLLAGVIGFGWRSLVFPKLGFGVQGLAILGFALSALSFTLVYSSSLGWNAIVFHTYPIVLAASLLGALLLGKLIEREFRHARSERSWKHDAYTDALTLVSNKRAFFEAAERLDQRHARFSLAVIDIDHFKRVNDIFGHSVGDEVLKHVAEQISACLPRDCELYRLGGEEFVVIFHGMACNDALKSCEEIRSTLDRNAKNHTAVKAPVTVSIGFAEGIDRLKCSEIIAAADAALYSAKRRGRNCVEASHQVLSSLIESETYPPANTRRENGKV